MNFVMLNALFLCSSRVSLWKNVRVSKSGNYQTLILGEKKHFKTHTKQSLDRVNKNVKSKRGANVHFMFVLLHLKGEKNVNCHTMSQEWKHCMLFL